RNRALQQESADRAGARRRSRGDGRRRVCRPAAPVGLSGSPHVNPTRVTAFAPGSVANVAIGFDILGFSVDSVGDRVTLTRTDRPGVNITAITGVVEDLPLAADRNTAGQALLALIQSRSLPFGLDVPIVQGI